MGSSQRYKIGYKYQENPSKNVVTERTGSKSKIIGQALWGPSIRLDEFLFIILKNQLLRENLMVCFTTHLPLNQSYQFAYGDWGFGGGCFRMGMIPKKNFHAVSKKRNRCLVDKINRFPL